MNVEENRMPGHKIESTQPIKRPMASRTKMGLIQISLESRARSAITEHKCTRFHVRENQLQSV